MFLTREVESAAIEDLACASNSSSSDLDTGVASAAEAQSSVRPRLELSTAAAEAQTRLASDARAEASSVDPSLAINWAGSARTTGEEIENERVTRWMTKIRQRSV